jgi:hypothetical protein
LNAADGKVQRDSAEEKLRSSMTWMRALRGATVFPYVELSSAPMKLKKVPGAIKQRPKFHIESWTDLRNGAAAIASPTKPAPKSIASAAPAAPAQIGKPVKEPSLEEELNDSIPF